MKIIQKSFPFKPYFLFLGIFFIGIVKGNAQSILPIKSLPKASIQGSTKVSNLGSTQKSKKGFDNLTSNRSTKSSILEDLPITPPKIIIGIVVDQMRYDYLYRFLSKYGQGGFRRLMQQGYNEKNTLYPYIPTATGPGHSSIFSGSVPAITGIIDNNWYSRKSKKEVYCVSDSTVQTVGSSSHAGMMSPRNLLVTTITDQLRLSNNFRSKVIGISQKDRASILPAGHTANAAYWFDSESGNFISSTYYIHQLPQWAQDFNNKNVAGNYLTQDWNTLLPLDQYIESDPDQEPYETLFSGETSSTFPHLISKIKRKNFELIRSTPYGNDLIKDFAIEAIQGEKLGKGSFTDFLTISFSSTDHIGHLFGPNSIEIEDTYLRLDKTLEQLLLFLDGYIGKENVLIFLTADHGVAPTVGFNQSHSIPSGSLSEEIFMKDINDFLTKNFGKSNLIESFSNDQFYLNQELIDQAGLKKEIIFAKLKQFLLSKEGVSNLVDLDNITQNNLVQDQLDRVKLGYNASRSGNFQLILQPNWLFGKSTGTSHGTGYHYDTHVPLLWYGWKIKPGESTEKIHITDIASTLSSWLSIEEPNGAIGKPLNIPLNP